MLNFHEDKSNQSISPKASFLWCLRPVEGITDNTDE
jgi:hypothetical protein